MPQISKALRFEILTRDGYRCRYCGASAETATMHIDHVLPRSKGGRNDAANLVTACADCNLGKADRKIVGIPAGFALTPDPRPGRLIRMMKGREVAAAQIENARNDRHWIDSGVLDVGDQADGQTLALLRCATHNRSEWHWLDDHEVATIEAWGAESGWVQGIPCITHP
jgi:hypothetical protein